MPSHTPKERRKRRTRTTPRKVRTVKRASGGGRRGMKRT